MPDREFRTRSETQVARDHENALLAQTRLSDLSPASVLAIMAREAIAPEIGQLYDAGLTIADAYYLHRPANSGSALDRRLADFGLARQDATTAYGVVTLYRLDGTAAQQVIASGTRVAARDAEGELIEFTIRGPVPAGNNPDIGAAPAGDVTLAAGAGQVSAVVDAALAGSSGSVGANAIVEWVDPKPANIGAPAGGTPANGITNLRAFTTGTDRDSDNAARQLFHDWLTARTPGTPAAILLGATTYEQEVTVAGEVRRIRPVASAAIVEYLDNPGAGGLAFSLYVMGQNGEQVSDAVMAALQQRIDGYTDSQTGQEIEGWRAAGTTGDIRRPNLLEAEIIVQLEGATPLQREQLKRRISSMVSALKIAEPLKIADIFREVCRIGEVDNATIISPEADQLAGATDKWIPATVTVT